MALSMSAVAFKGEVMNALGASMQVGTQTQAHVGRCSGGVVGWGVHVWSTDMKTLEL